MSEQSEGGARTQTESAVDSLAASSAKRRAQHTPAPWEAVLHEDRDVSGCTFSIRMGSHLGGRNGWEPQHAFDYEMPSRDESPDQFAEGKANAQLIAAAPNLLAACRAVLCHLDGSTGEVDAVAILRNVIAKAEGR